MASTTLHIQLETAASQQTQDTIVAAPKTATNFQGGLAASKWATAEDVAPKLSNAKGKKRNAPKAAASAPKSSSSSSSKTESAQPKKQKQTRRFIINGRWQNVPRTETATAPAKQHDTNHTQPQWRVQPGSASNNLVAAPVSEVSEPIFSPAVVSELLQREHFDWAEELEELEETQPVSISSESTSLTPNENGYNLVEELNAAGEHRMKAYRRALLANLPTLQETGQDA